MAWLHFREPFNTWTHLFWMLLAAPATVLLWRRSRGDRPKQLSLLIYGLGLIFCFGCSALYHGLTLPAEQLRLFVTLDHIGIYVLIAATCTGMVFTLGRGPWKWFILIGVWLVAAAGILSQLLITEIPRWLNPSIYLVMGWSLAYCHPRLVQAVSPRPVRLIWLGGLFYTLGAVCLLLHWPILWPGVLGAHELLHLFGMAGSLTHLWFVLRYVVPFERAAIPTRPVCPLLTRTDHLAISTADPSRCARR